MKTVFLLLIVVLGICLGGEAQAQQEVIIQHIEFQGIKKSNPAYLQRFMTLQPGDPFDSLKTDKDVQALRNLNLFTKVSYTIRDTAGGITLVYDLEEVITLLPIVSLGGIKGNFWFQAGAMDVHWRGKGQTLGGFYRYYNRHSFQVFYKNPYIKGSRWGYGVTLAYLATVEPVYFVPTTVFYDFDNITIDLSGRYEIFLRSYLQLSSVYFKEKYARNDPIDSNVVAPLAFEKTKWLVKLTYDIDKRNYFYQYLSGFSNNIFLEQITTKGETDRFFKVMNVFKYFLRIGGKGNLALRSRFGVSTNTSSPFSPFVLDSYVNIRGAGNKVARGTSELVFNLEYRHTLMDHSQFCIQGVAFVDAGGWRSPGSPLKDTFDPDNVVKLAGLGFRICLYRFYNTILRVDYGIDWEDVNQRGIVIGLGQYF